MKKRTCALVVGVFVAASGLAASSRTAVSVNGSDSNPCTVASPCRSFSAAIAQTASGGDVVALDSGGYGTFIVNQSVTLEAAPGVYAGITVPSGGTGVIVNLSSGIAI